jgi:hypothetical protein
LLIRQFIESQFVDTSVRRLCYFAVCQFADLSIYRQSTRFSSTCWESAKKRSTEILAAFEANCGQIVFARSGYTARMNCAQSGHTVRPNWCDCKHQRSFIQLMCLEAHF